MLKDEEQFFTDLLTKNLNRKMINWLWKEVKQEGYCFKHDIMKNALTNLLSSKTENNYELNKDLKDFNNFIEKNVNNNSDHKQKPITNFTLMSLHNSFTSLPESIVQLSCLKIFDLRGTLLRNLPENIGQLKNLEELDLRCNAIENIPESIGQLQKLEYLDLSKNILKSLPESLGKLKSLRHLYLNDNFFVDLPKSIVNLKNLEILDLENTYTSSLPEGIIKLNKLREINLFDIPGLKLTPTQKKWLKINDDAISFYAYNPLEE